MTTIEIPNWDRKGNSQFYIQQPEGGWIDCYNECYRTDNFVRKIMENQKPAPEERPEVSFVTKEMMEDYEFIRQTGVANMFDYYSVTAFARKTGAISIANLSSEDYKKILLNFGYLMKKFDIKQPGRKNASD